MMWTARQQHFLAAVVLLFAFINSIDCYEAGDKGLESIKDVYSGLTDRDVILSLIKRIDDLEQWSRNLEERNRIADELNRKQEQDINDLKSTVHEQRTRLQWLERAVKSKQRDSVKKVQSLENVIPEESVNVTDEPEGRASSANDASSDTPRSGVVKIDGDVPLEVQEDIPRERRQVDSGTRVAFFAKTEDGHHLEGLGAEQVLEFKNVTTNIGNGYSSNTGVFTAPYSGTYVFSTSLMGVSGHNTHYYIAKNSAEVSRLYIRGTDSPYTTSSHTVVLQLKQGDDVEIRNMDSGEGVYGGHYSSFSGFLLYFEEDSGFVVG